jgi:hypothetical protein
MYVFTLIVNTILVFGFSDINNKLIFQGFMYSALFAGIVSLPTKSSVFQFGKYLVVVGMGILFTIMASKSEGFQKLDIQAQKFFIIMMIVCWTVFIVASIISAFIAVYTYKNIGEVLSRRMLYRNSNVSIFEYSWLYTLDRFCNISISITVCIFWLAGGVLFGVIAWQLPS